MLATFYFKQKHYKLLSDFQDDWKLEQTLFYSIDCTTISSAVVWPHNCYMIRLWVNEDKNFESKNYKFLILGTLKYPDISVHY